MVTRALPYNIRYWMWFCKHLYLRYKLGITKRSKFGEAFRGRLRLCVSGHECSYRRMARLLHWFEERVQCTGHRAQPPRPRIPSERGLEIRRIPSSCWKEKVVGACNSLGAWVPGTKGPIQTFKEGSPPGSEKGVPGAPVGRPNKEGVLLHASALFSVERLWLPTLGTK